MRIWLMRIFLDKKNARAKDRLYLFCKNCFLSFSEEITTLQYLHTQQSTFIAVFGYSLRVDVNYGWFHTTKTWKKCILLRQNTKRKRKKKSKIACVFFFPIPFFAFFLILDIDCYVRYLIFSKHESFSRIHDSVTCSSNVFTNLLTTDLRFFFTIFLFVVQWVVNGWLHSVFFFVKVNSYIDIFILILNFVKILQIHRYTLSPRSPG